MKDYVTPGKGKKTRYPIANYLSYLNITPRYQCYLSNFSTVVEPHCYSQDAEDERWIEAMKLEIKALKDNNTWKVVDLSQGKNVFGSK